MRSRRRPPRCTSASRRSTGPARWVSTSSTARSSIPTLDPRKPEVLVYAPDRGGRLHLVALEYVVFQAPWIAIHGSAMPTLFHQMFMATGDPNRFEIPAFFSLHVWLYKHNPSGCSPRSTRWCRATRATGARGTTRGRASGRPHSGSPATSTARPAGPRPAGPEPATSPTPPVGAVRKPGAPHAPGFGSPRSHPRLPGTIHAMTRWRRPHP